MSCTSGVPSGSQCSVSTLIPEPHDDTNEIGERDQHTLRDQAPCAEQREQGHEHLEVPEAVVGVEAEVAEEPESVRTEVPRGVLAQRACSRTAVKPREQDRRQHEDADEERAHRCHEQMSDGAASCVVAQAG